MAQQKRSSGAVKWFNGQKGYGFITPNDGSEDIFVHQSSIRADGFRTLGEGEQVEFDIGQGDDGRTKAVDVTGPNGSNVSGVGVGVGVGGGGGGRGFSRGNDRDGGYGNFGGGFGRGWRSGGRGGRSGGGGHGGRSGGGGYGGGGGACYTCGKTGHLARDCYQGSGGGRYSGDGGSGGGRYGGDGGRYGGDGGRYGGDGGGGGGGRSYQVGGRGCFNCGEKGHFARECLNDQRS